MTGWRKAWCSCYTHSGLSRNRPACNVGDMYLVTADGFENLSRHTPLETFRATDR